MMLTLKNMVEHQMLTLKDMVEHHNVNVEEHGGTP